MKYYSYFKFDPDPNKREIVTLSEQEILDQNWEWWREKMIKKYGKTYFEEQFSERDCIFDWVVDNWAKEDMKLEEAITIKSGEEPYIAVWADEEKLKFRLFNHSNADDFIITLDKKILPDLVDALIELQNQ